MRTIFFKRKFIFDIGLNIFASAIPICILQFYVYPYIATVVGGERYGLMISIYSIWMLIANTFGNSLNNIRLLNNERLNNDGDFSLLFFRFLFMSSLICFFAIWYYFNQISLLHIGLGVLVSACIYIRSYYEVGFRINLNYRFIAINSIILSLGYIIGFLFFKMTELWELVFFFGFGASCVFCLLTSGIKIGKVNKSNNYKSIRNEYYNLLFAGVINSFTSYADKLILYPLIGGTAVSVYYTATVLGKVVGMITGPASNVVLSYISKWGNEQKTIIKRICIVCSIFLFIGYFFTILVGRCIISVLYPLWSDDAIKILPITTGTVMLEILISILRPFSLKYCEMKWQCVISVVGSTVYIVMAIILWMMFGFAGFCFGTIIGTFSKLITLLIVYYKTIKPIKENKN